MVPDSVQGTSRVEDEPRLGEGGGEEPRNLTRLDSLSLSQPPSIRRRRRLDRLYNCPFNLAVIGQENGVHNCLYHYVGTGPPSPPLPLSRTYLRCVLGGGGLGGRGDCNTFFGGERCRTFMHCNKKYGLYVHAPKFARPLHFSIRC